MQMPEKQVNPEPNTCFSTGYQQAGNPLISPATMAKV